jgi:hypothetical protein
LVLRLCASDKVWCGCASLPRRVRPCRGRVGAGLGLLSRLRYPAAACGGQVFGVCGRRRRLR